MLLNSVISRKTTAAFLLLIFLNNLIFPTISFALTSGPTQPEATSFEPIDTTDMVSPFTGSFTYNMPLIEIPGPEGGYPLSLSYHAGIQPNEDASWVGLGWTLNPGAINRSVNGYPDDWKNLTGTDHAYWSGGVRKTYSAGINTGISNMINASFGLSVSQDTYLGFGVGFDLGLDASLGNSGLKAGVTYGVTPYGDNYASLGVSKGFDLGGHWGGSVGLNATTNFESLDYGFSGGVGYDLPNRNKPSAKNAPDNSYKFSALGFNISTGSNKPSFDVGGLSASVTSTTAAKVQTHSTGFSIDIPLGAYNVNLGYNKVKYKTDELSSTSLKGALNASTNSNNTITDNAAFDSYSLLQDPSEKNVIDYPDPSVLQGGAYLDFDVYNVNAQGLGGNMRPYQWQGEALGQNRRNDNGDYLTKYYSPKPTQDDQPQFRFVNDFSNSYRQNYNNYTATQLNQDLTSVPPPFGAPVYGNNDGNTGFLNNQLAGSKHVDIGVKIKPYNCLGYNKADRYLSGMIEGFSITNESGVTYHFCLPAYSYGEEIYQEKINKEKINKADEVFCNRQTKSQPYAYTWYLTTITGPDYVDKNNDGYADDGDWGYWVDFEYGKWSNNYIWRNPGQYFNRDDDNEWQNCSMGYREVYYLNAIRTRSHIAIFEKDSRYDALGESGSIFTKNADYTYTHPSGFYSNLASSQSMRLSKIYLLNAADENIVSAAGGLSSNVIDKIDIDPVRTTLESKSIRIIDFQYDYSLCPKTANSLDANNLLYGKLTLLSVDTRGKGGISCLPPTKFNYELPTDKQITATGTLTSTQFVDYGDLGLQTGDLLVENSIFCGVIASVAITALPENKHTYNLVNSLYTGGTITATVITTKNPPYNKDAFDEWGLYKSDINTPLITKNENAARNTSIASAYGVDCWSLRRISTSLGEQIDISYEGGDYSTSVLSSTYPLQAQTIERTSGYTNRLKVTFLNIDGINLADYFTVGKPANMLIALENFDPSSVVYNAYPLCGWISQKFTNDVFDTKTSLNATTVVDIGDNYITVENSDFSGFYQTPIIVKDINGANTSTYCGTNKNPVAANVECTLLNSSRKGGIRVNSITFNSNDNRIILTSYNYNVPAGGTSSGLTAYEPSVFDQVNYLSNHTQNTDGKKSYERELYKKVSNLYSIARELPPPGIMYEYVTIARSIKNADESGSRQLEGSTQYHFEVFHSNMIGRIDAATQQTGSYNGIPQYSRILTIEKFTSCLGNLKSIIQFNSLGQKMTETINTYLHDGIENLPFDQFMAQYKTLLSQYRYQGYLQERYTEVKQVTNQSISTDNGVKATMSTKEEYPCIQTGQTIKNYLNGTLITSENIAFDFYSGALLKSVETDAYGNRMMTEAIPAYHKYSQMGLKVSSVNNKNMLTQIAENYTWRVNINNVKLYLATANVQRWANASDVLQPDNTIITQNVNNNIVGNVWRPTYTYSWMPVDKTSNGLTHVNDFVDFNWSDPNSSDVRWIRTSQNTLYDVYSHTLEAKDINGNYVATKMGYGNSKVIITGSLCKYNEIAFSGAEDSRINNNFGGNVSPGESTIFSATGILNTAHSGEKSLLTSSETNSFNYTVNVSALTTRRDYYAMVWVKSTTATPPTAVLGFKIDNTTISTANVSSTQSGNSGWYQIILKIPGASLSGGTTLNVFCRNTSANNEYFDDFLFTPLNASTTAYVYDSKSGELSYILDGNDLYTRFEYDPAGRLVRTYRESLRNGDTKTKEYQYNLKGFGSNLIPNDAINNQSFIKNNCNTNEQGSAVSVSVPAGMFYSTSLADANAQAQAYAQAQANNQGHCSMSIHIKCETGVNCYISFKQNGQAIQGVTASGEFDYTINNVGTYDIEFGNTENPKVVRTYEINYGQNEYSHCSGTSPSYSCTLLSVPVKGPGAFNIHIF